MKDPFSLPLLQAISDWQRGGNAGQVETRAQTLKENCFSLPEEYRTCDSVCYRQIALPKGSVWDLIGDNCLPEKTSSWTLDIEIAKVFKGGVPPEGQGYQGTIVSLTPPSRSVIVNLSKLYEEPEFVKSMKNNKSAIKNYEVGAGRYHGTQREVVLEIESITQENIYSLGGHSSPLDALITLAASEAFGCPPTLKERQALLLKANNAGVTAGPNWLNWDATKRVLDRIKPKANVLAEFKRLQESGR